MKIIGKIRFCEFIRNYFTNVFGDKQIDAGFILKHFLLEKLWQVQI